MKNKKPNSKYFQQTLFKKPFYCPDKKLMCNICLYMNRCKFTKGECEN